MTDSTPDDKELIAELESGMLLDEIDPEAAFTAQLESWFAMHYQRESVRVQYQRMVAMGKRKGEDPNLAPVVRQYGLVKYEMDVIEDLMSELLGAQESDVKERLIDGNHYYPTRGVTFTLPESLKTRLRA